MPIPERNGHAVQGGWANGSTTINGNTNPTDLIITDRYNATPMAYMTTNSISFTGEYIDNGNDDYVAYIDDGNTTSGGNGGSTNGENGYRYGFNGQEHSDDVTEGNYTALFWEYDSRIGRRWNVDPILKTNESPYLTFGCNPILLSDPLGDDWGVSTSKKGNTTTVNLTFTAAVLNKSGKKIGDIKKMISRMEADIKKTYSGKDGDVIFKTTATIREISNISDVKKNEHVIYITSDYVNYDYPPEKGMIKAVGATSEIFGKEIFVNYNWALNILKDGKNRDRNVIAHEAGHTGGLLHYDDNQDYSKSEVAQTKETAVFLGTWQKKTGQMYNGTSNGVWKASNLMQHITINSNQIKTVNSIQIKALVFAIQNGLANQNTVNGTYQLDVPQIKTPPNVKKF